MAWQSVYVSRCRSLHGTLLPTLAVGTFQSAVDNPVVGTFQLAVDRPCPLRCGLRWGMEPEHKIHKLFHAFKSFLKNILSG